MSSRSPASSSRRPVEAGPADAARHLVGQQPHDLLAEDPLGLVVRLAGAAGAGAGGVDEVAVSRAGWPSTSITTGRRGSCWRSRTAAAITAAISVRPFTAAVAAGSGRRASRPGNSCPTCPSTTEVSPSDGRTCPM
jgi:hypothetical protein